jgi:DNA-binding NarL/FixJ family response regulator
MSAKLKAMIVDDHLVVREGLKQLLEVGGEIQVTAEASNGLECMRQLEKHSPDLIFMDVRMPGISGIETTRLVHQKYPHIKSIMLTIYDDDQYVNEGIRAGANGYVLKKVQREELIQIIQLVMRNQAFLDPSVTEKVFNRLKGERNIPERNEKVSLTHRELEILKGMVAGHTDRKIGDFLHVSEHTVRSHIKSIYRKLRVCSKSQAVARALKYNIIQEEE